MEISAEKTKLMTNNTSGTNTEIKVSTLVLRAQSTTKDYIRAEHKLLSPSYSFHKSSYYMSVVGFFLVFFPIFIPWALNTRTCIQQGDLFYYAGLHRNHVLAIACDLGREHSKRSVYF